MAITVYMSQLLAARTCHDIVINIPAGIHHNRYSNLYRTLSSRASVESHVRYLVRFKNGILIIYAFQDDSMKRLAMFDAFHIINCQHTNHFWKTSL
jgi:hypothetical protein